MVPNPIVMPRREKPELRQSSRDVEVGRTAAHAARTSAVAGICVLAVLVVSQPWARRWLYSGCAIESLLIVYGSGTETRVFTFVPLWTLLASLNLVYAVASTSWLLYNCFTLLCWPVVLFTSLLVSSSALQFTRRRLRSLIKHFHFIGDKIAFINLPALAIDVEVTGLLVVRGMTISLSTLTIEAYGIELGLKLPEDVELALTVDKVVIVLFRRIEIGAVYSAVKGGDLDDDLGDDGPTTEQDDSLAESRTATNRGSSGNAGSLQPPRPNVTRELTGGAAIQDTSARAGIKSVTSVALDDDSEAEQQYLHMRNHILITSPVQQSRELVERELGAERFSNLGEKDMRAAICAKMQGFKSVPHPPTSSIRVTTLQNLPPPWLRRFLHRLPFLLRLLLLPVSYLHPINISSFSVAGSGRWLATMLGRKILKHYPGQDAKIRKLQDKMFQWLIDAKFCLDLADVDALGQVPLRPIHEIISYIRCADITLLRTALDDGVVESAMRLGGADATFVIPSFMLPHHEHMIPAAPTEKERGETLDKLRRAADPTQQKNAEEELEDQEEDQTKVLMSVHGKFPAYFNQSLLDFAAALLKATKIIEMNDDDDDEGDDDDDDDNDDQDVQHSGSPSTINSPAGEDGNTAKTVGKRRKLANKAKNLGQNIKNGMMKTAIGNTNDQWMAKMVGRFGSLLERVQGDLGYSGFIPVPLATYRGTVDVPSKLLP